MSVKCKNKRRQNRNTVFEMSIEQQYFSLSIDLYWPVGSVLSLSVLSSHLKSWIGPLFYILMSRMFD